jgi:outer membrane protein insertion porin family
MRKLILLGMIGLLVLSCASGADYSRQSRRGGPVVSKIHIVGATHFSDKDIKGVMRTEASKFLRTRRLRESTLESDLISIKAFYSRNGFLETEVREERAYEDDGEKVEVSILVDEGPQTGVAEVLFEGNILIETERLVGVIKVKPGEPLNERLIGEDRYLLYTYYADRGFVFASVGHEVTFTDGEATVRYIVAEGRPAPIGSLSVRGSGRVSDAIVLREVTLKTGDTFSGKKMVDSQQNVLDTGLFKDVEIEPKASEADSVAVDLIVKVKERKMRELSFRVGYGTLDEARLSGGWLHRNLWNSGRSMEVRGTLGSRDLNKGLTRIRADLAFADRWLFGRRLVGSIGIFGQETLEEYKAVENGEYTLDRLGINLSVKKDILKITKLTLAYTHEIVDVRDPSWSVEEDEDFRLQVGQDINRSLGFILSRDTRRPFFDPRGGSNTRVAAQRTGGIFGGDNNFNKMALSWARYFKWYLGSVVAFSTRTGYASAFGASKDKGVPEYEKFYAGGSATIRGYDDREFGPGDFLLLANVEMRFHLFWRVAGVTFIDMGNAWQSINDVEASDFKVFVPGEEYALRRDTDVKYTIGVGIGAQTPVGPIMIDYGYRIKRAVDEEGHKESPGRFHFLVGHAF